MKKSITITIITLCTLLCFTTCQSVSSMLEEPVISLDSVELAGVNINGAQILCKVAIENPNSFDIPLPEINWELFLNSNSFLNGAIKVNQRIRGREKTIVEIPVGLEYLSAFNAITSLKGRDAANYKIALSVKFPIPIIGDRFWNLEHEGNVPLPQLPRLTAPAINFERLDLSGITVVFTVNVNNPNSFELPPPKISFDFQVNRTSIVSSNTSTAGALRPNSTTPIQMRFTVNQADLLRTLGASLLSGSSLGCNLITSFDFGIPAFGSEPVTLQVPGTMPLR